MNALAKARRIAQEESSGAQCFRHLLDALERGDHFPLARLHELGYTDFDLALEVLNEWWLERKVGAPVVTELFYGPQPQA